MLILASKSPRRIEILKQLGKKFEIIPSQCAEHSTKKRPSARVVELATQKAFDVANKYPTATVIGADTLVFIDGEPLGKPADEAQAKAMLQQLQGRTHSVCTAVAVIMPDGSRRDFTETSHVTFRPLDEAAIRHYMSLVHVFDKAGAYATQEHGELIIETFEGDLDNVIGLPVTRLLQVLRS